MRRLLALTMAAVAILTLAGPVAAAGPQRFKDSYTATGLGAWNYECGQSTCTDTSVWAEAYSTSSGDQGTYVCVDIYTYSLHGRRDGYSSGCTEGVALTVADDLSSATLAPTSVEICGRSCSTVTVSATLDAVADAASFRSRGSSRDGTCTFTYSDSGRSRWSEGTIDLDGASLTAEGEIRTYQSTFTERCK